jgi:hypothetical protein
MIPIAMALAQFAPQIIGLLAGNKAAQIADQVVGIAQTVTGTASPDAALQSIRGNPETALQFQRVIADKEIELARIDADVLKAQFGVQVEEIKAATENAGQVNETMRKEADAEHWPTYSWRPAIGFAVAFNVASSSVLVVGVFAAQVFGAQGASAAVAALPSALGALAAITAMAAPIVGVASYFRGKMQADPAVPTINRG